MERDWIWFITYLLLIILTFVSWIIPDPIPFIDEISLPILTFFVARKWIDD